MLRQRLILTSSYCVGLTKGRMYKYCMFRPTMTKINSLIWDQPILYLLIKSIIKKSVVCHKRGGSMNTQPQKLYFIDVELLCYCIILYLCLYQYILTLTFQKNSSIF